MGDFHQTGVISTLPRFPTACLERLEADLHQFALAKPITLALPSLISELDRPALWRIVNELKEATYLRQIVVSLDNADEAGFQRAREFFAVLPQEVRIIWNDGGRISELYRRLDQQGLRTGPGGKGRGVWAMIAYGLAEGGSAMMAFHDCDIVNYERGLLARLCYPIANPNFNYEFCKGYYPRVNGRIYGRVTRLFVMPLIRAAQTVLGPSAMLSYLDSFRYPLAGEFALTFELARANRMAGDWGMDFGLLAEVFRNTSTQRICQTELIETYEHKHQPISELDPEKGLFKMSTDIAKTFFRNVGAEGTVFSEGVMGMLSTAYRAAAEDMIGKYHDIAMINALPFDWSQEERAVATFAEGLRRGAEAYMADPLENAELPNWNQIVSALPGFAAQLCDAVEADNEDRKVYGYRVA